jgi:hypothetical protein
MHQLRSAARSHRASSSAQLLQLLAPQLFFSRSSASHCCQERWRSALLVEQRSWERAVADISRRATTVMDVPWGATPVNVGRNSRQEPCRPCHLVG